MTHATVPAKYRALYHRALAGDVSPRQAVKAKCQECCGWEDVLARVGGCSVRTCPLWPLRPYQEAAGARQPFDRESSAADRAVDDPEAVRPSQGAAGARDPMEGGDLMEAATHRKAPRP